MSRSEKKVAGWPLNKSKYHKRQANKKIRRMGVCAVTDGCHYKKYYDRYNILDWKWLCFTATDFKYFLRYSNVDELYKLWRK